MKLTFYFSLILIAGCAGQIPPDGGAIDFDSPMIISSSFPNNGTNFNLNKIYFEFSEYVDKRSVEESIFISPIPGKIEYLWNGTEIAIQFTDNLKKNTTYSISFGTDIVDLNNRNRMGESFNYSFSTGNNIDKGKIIGKIFYEKSDGIIVGAYKLLNKNDQIDPSKIIPDYITQTGRWGNYQFLNLSAGNYRIFCFKDEYRNLKYDVEVDAIGIPTNDVGIFQNDSTVNILNFTLEKDDITPPRLISAQFLDETRIKIIFSEAVKTSSINIEKLNVIDTITNANKKILGLIFITEEANEGIIVTENLNSNSYILQVRNILDLKDNMLKPENGIVRITGSKKIFKYRNQLIYSTLGDTNYLQLLDPILKFTFDNIINKEIAKIDYKLISIDSIIIPVNIDINGGTIYISPKTKLSSNNKYYFELKMDSLYKFKFTTTEIENRGSISGIINSQNTDSTLNYILQISKIDAIKYKAQNIFLTKRGKQFNIENIEPGNISLFAYCDKNLNGRFDKGKIIPFTPSEKYVFYPDTLRIRPRWPIDGVNINFP
ncbi:MAG: Ig-like domain-containing protein [Bacteroidetes bacterium]|nr:Ig-like domain-containing protein [Bacteroidota bacterium]